MNKQDTGAGSSGSVAGKSTAGKTGAPGHNSSVKQVAEGGGGKGVLTRRICFWVAQIATANRGRLHRLAVVLGREWLRE